MHKDEEQSTLLALEETLDLVVKSAPFVARAFRAMHKALVAEGFSDKQACELLKNVKLQ